MREENPLEMPPAKANGGSVMMAWMDFGVQRRHNLVTVAAVKCDAVFFVVGLHVDIWTVLKKYNALVVGERSPMRRTFVSMISIVLFFTTFAFSGEKARDWQTGKVLDTERSRYFAGTEGNANTTGNARTQGRYETYEGHTNTSQTAVYHIYQTFLIEGETHAYLAQQRLRWRWSKPANLAVNGPVKFAAEKHKLFVIDDDGKEHAMEIIKRVLRLPEQTQPPKQ